MSTIIGLVSTFRLPLHFLALFGLLTCPSPPRSPTPTILLYLDALTSPIRKRIRAMPVLLCYQHCSVRYIFNFALISSIS